MNKQELRAVIDRAIDAVREHIREEVLFRADKVFKHGVKKVAVKTDEEMRCRHERKGVRCKERSGGPRFHFLCKKHRAVMS